MQPDPEQPEKPPPPTPEERKAMLATARYWYDVIKKGDTTVPERAKKNIDECLDRTGVSLKELLNSDRSNDELEQELQQDIKNVNKRLARQHYADVLAGKYPRPEIFVGKMRDSMRKAGVETLQQLFGDEVPSKKREDELDKVLKPHLPRINVEKAEVLYLEIISTEKDVQDLGPHMKKIDEHLKLAAAADPKHIYKIMPGRENDEVLAPYRSAGGNMHLGHARRIYADLMGGRIQPGVVDDYVSDVQIHIRLSKLVDPKLKLGIDPTGKLSDDEMINEVYEKERRDFAIPPGKYRRSAFADDYKAFREALEDGKADKAKEKMDKIRKDFLATYPYKDKATEFKSVLGDLRYRYDDDGDAQKALRGDDYKELKEQVDKAEETARKEVEKVSPVKPFTRPKLPDREPGMEPVSIPSELAKKLALEAVQDRKPLGIPYVPVSGKDELGKA